LISAKNRVDLSSISEVRSYITEWPRFFGPPCMYEVDIYKREGEGEGNKKVEERELKKSWTHEHSGDFILCPMLCIAQCHALHWTDKKYKKFELMLTGRAKAYSSSCPQAVTHHSTNQARRRVTSFQLKRVTNYATPPKPVPWRHLVNDFVLQLEIARKIHKTPYFGVQGHPRSLNLAPIESQCTTSY